jgi:FkbM family methyltransferase
MAYKNTHWNTRPLEGKDIKMRGVIHVGAHYGQEYLDYINNGITDIVFIEPLSANYQKLLELYDFPESVKTFNLALGNIKGEVEMYVETFNHGQSSSILEPGSHLNTYPKITFDNREMVKIEKMDNLDIDRKLYNVLNIDVQGYELEVLKGAEKTLEYIDVIFTEINTGDVYKGCAKLGDLDDFLARRGFDRFWEHIHDNICYGDAIYLRR